VGGTLPCAEGCWSEVEGRWAGAEGKEDGIIMERLSGVVGL
jgi:hypothetical protein